MRQPSKVYQEDLISSLRNSFVSTIGQFPYRVVEPGLESTQVTEIIIFDHTVFIAQDYTVPPALSGSQFWFFPLLHFDLQSLLKRSYQPIKSTPTNASTIVDGVTKKPTPAQGY